MSNYIANHGARYIWNLSTWYNAANPYQPPNWPLNMLLPITTHIRPIIAGIITRIVVVRIFVVRMRILVFDSLIGVVLHINVILLPRSRLQINGGRGVIGSAR